VLNKMSRSNENAHFCVWQGRRSRPSEDGRCSLTPSRREISRLNAESFCYVLLIYFVKYYCFENQQDYGKFYMKQPGYDLGIKLQGYQ